MADATFKGTTQLALTQIGAGGKIDTNTKVTLTDNLYTIADLAAIKAVATANKIELEKTAASVAFENDYATINPVLAGVEKYTGPVTLTDAGGVNVTNLNTIAAATTGKVTATLTSTAVDAALVTALADAKATDNISFTASNAALADNSDVRALIDLSKILPKANYDAILSITSNEVSLVKQALTIIKKNAITAVDTVVTFSGSPISAKDANDIAKATDGILTATIKDGGVAATLKALSDVTSADNITFTTTDRTVKASDLANLGAKFKTIANFNVASVTKITGESKDITSIVKAIAIAADADVTVSGTIKAADVATIKAAASTGVLTATVEAGEADQLNSILTAATATDELALKVTGETALATDLNSLITKTAGTIKLEAKDVRGDFADVEAVYVTNKAHFTNLGNENVTIHTNTPNATQLSTIAAATTGKVTATLDPTITINAATVAALKDVKTSDNITFVTSDTTLAGKDELNALLAIKKLIPNADFKKIVTIAADAKDVALVKSVLKDVAPNVAVTITGDISAADANAIAKATNGIVTATIKDGSVAATLKALSDIDGTLDDLTFKTTDTTAKASDLVALAALIKTPANLDVSAVKTLTGTAADAASGDIAAALAIIDSTAATNFTEVKISGNVDVTDIKAIIDATSGKVTATLAAATASDLVAALADTSPAVGGNAINVTVDDTIITNAAGLSKAAGISGLTSGKIKVDALQIDGNFADLNELYVTNKAQFTNLGNENVVISAATTALNVDSIAKATSGILTATVTDATANVLVSQLKNANAKDALTIKVIDGAAGTTTSAKDLLTLDGKTSVTLDVSTLALPIIGTAADVKKVYESAGIGAFSGTELVTLSGTVKAADANAIAKLAGGAVSANVAADTAAKLLVALDDAKATDKLNLTVNGSTAKAADLIALKLKTANDIKVDAKEITGTSAELATAGTGLYVLATGFTGLGNKNVKVIDNSLNTTAEINTVLGATTGIVTAIVADTAAILNSTLTNATNGKDALTLVITPAANIAASDLLGLDAKTSVKVDATNSGISVAGLAAQLKELVAAKGVQLAKNVDIRVSDIAVSASDLGAILKATTGIVTANVTPSTASALNSALKDASSSDALTLKVSGSTATAKDLLSLDAKTSANIGLTVGEITGNIAEITNVFVTNAAGFVTAELGVSNANISGTVDAAAADKIADETTGVVTATIKADTAAVLNTTLTDGNTNAYKLTVTGASAKATDLEALNTKTSVAVDASAIKNIDGTIPAGAVEVNKVVTAANAGQITGLGNETVNLTGALDADTLLVKAINDFTTGVVTLDVLTFENTAGQTFNLASSLGDLNGITALGKIDAENIQTDIISLTLSDVLAANDSSSTFTFNIDAEATDTTNITLDAAAIAAGWTKTANGNGGDLTVTYTKGSQSVTIVSDEGTVVFA